MPDPALSAAIEEAYASAPSDVVILHTLELVHPSLTEPIRVVRDVADLDARLEASAPVDAGQVVLFRAAAFDLVPPEQSTAALPRAVVEIDNVDPAIYRAVSHAARAGTPIEITYRPYLAEEALLGPDIDPPVRLTVQGVTATVFRIRATCGWPDLLNLSFPKLVYDLDRFPGLQP